MTWQEVKSVVNRDVLTCAAVWFIYNECRSVKLMLGWQMETTRFCDSFATKLKLTLPWKKKKVIVCGRANSPWLNRMQRTPRLTCKAVKGMLVHCSEPSSDLKYTDLMLCMLMDINEDKKRNAPLASWNYNEWIWIKAWILCCCWLQRSVVQLCCSVQTLSLSSSVIDSQKIIQFLPPLLKENIIYSGIRKELNSEAVINEWLII